MDSDASGRPLGVLLVESGKDGMPLRSSPLIPEDWQSVVRCIVGKCKEQLAILVAYWQARLEAGSILSRHRLEAHGVEPCG